MAWKNIQREIDDFFAEVAKGVREELDSEYAHILEVNYKTAAIGFHNAASEIAGTDKYLGAKSGKLAFENILRSLCLEFAGNTAGLQPGQVFRSVKMTARGGGGIKKIGIPNVRVLEADRSSCRILVDLSNASQSQKPDKFFTNFRKMVWNKFNEVHGTKLKYTSSVGINTNFGHSQQSTVGLKQVQKLGEKLQNDPKENPFDKAEAFLGKVGTKKMMSLSAYVENELLGQGASLQFSQEDVGRGYETVVIGRIDPGNTAGSEITDKRHFNKFFKQYYKEKFFNSFNAKDTKDRKALAKLAGYKTIGSFEASEPYNKRAKKKVIETVTKELTKSKRLKTTKKVEKVKKVKRKKTYKPKRKKSAVLKNAGLLAVNKRGKKAKGAARTQPDLLKLRNLINAMLPDELLSQMQLPRLRNRTGRFRNSARVTDLRVGPRGGTEIDYTYQLDPYQTFEPGGAQGSTNRDPRALIGGTIREIAQELMGAKFIKTRRV